MIILSKVKTIIDRYFRNRCVCYISPTIKCRSVASWKFQFADDIQALGGIRHNNDFEQVCIDRFQKGHRLYYLENEEAIIAYGWKSIPLKQFYVWEIADEMTVDREVVVLYDFQVDKQFRKKGIYSNLLRHICNENQQLMLIYALIDNVPSLRGIENAGFIKTGNICHGDANIII